MYINSFPTKIYSIPGGMIELVHGDITKISADIIVNAANSDLRPGAGVCGAIYKAAGFDQLHEETLKIGRCSTGRAMSTPAFNLPARYVFHAVGPIYEDGFAGEDILLAATYDNCYHQLAKINSENSKINLQNTCKGQYEYLRGDESSTEQIPVSIYKCNSCGKEYTRYHPNRKPEGCFEQLDPIRPCMSISFPAISTGVYNYPIEDATKIAVASAVEFAKHVISNGKNGFTTKFVCFTEADFQVYERVIEQDFGINPITT